MITLTLGSTAYTSELVQLSEQVDKEPYSRPNIFFSTKIIYRQNMSSNNTASVKRDELAMLSDSCAELGHVATSVDYNCDGGCKNCNTRCNLL